MSRVGATVARVPIRPSTHRAAGRARRAALLDAAVEVIAEDGVAGATHRAIAARAGVPLSTTSYFFASIDELVTAAMQVVAERLITQVDGIAAELGSEPVDVEAAVDRLMDLLDGVRAVDLAAQFEVYVQCARRSQLQPVAHHMMTSFERAAEVALRAVGVPRPAEAARAVVALIDGFQLHRLAWPRGAADRRALDAGVRAVVRSYLIAVERG